MKKKCFKTAILVALTAVFIFGMSPASAADFPESPVSMVVAYSPGGAAALKTALVQITKS